MLAITGDHIIIGTQSGNGAYADRFLSDIQVTKAANLSEAIGLGTLFLKAANQEHLLKDVQQSLAIFRQFR